ncbi:hypothetical protein ACQ4WX_48950 [Streptomyces lasalocidi]
MAAFSLFYHHANTLWLRSTGYDYPGLRGAHEYFNIAYYLPITHAYARGATALHLGMESLHAKSLRGAVISPLWAVEGECPDRGVHPESAKGVNKAGSWSSPWHGGGIRAERVLMVAVYCVQGSGVAMWSARLRRSQPPTGANARAEAAPTAGNGIYTTRGISTVLAEQAVAVARWTGFLGAPSGYRDAAAVSAAVPAGSRLGCWSRKQETEMPCGSP